MGINYWWVGALILLVLILVVWLIRRNRKDKEVFERESNLSELKPEKHDEDEQLSS